MIGTAGVRRAAESDIQNGQSASQREERGVLKRSKKFFESVSSDRTGLQVLASFEGGRARRLQRLHTEHPFSAFKLWLEVSGSKFQQTQRSIEHNYYVTVGGEEACLT